MDNKDIIVSIPDDVIKAAQSMDKAMRNIQNAMVGVGKEFSNMGRGTKPIVDVLNSLDKNVSSIAQKLGAIGTTGAAATQAINTGMQSADTATKGLATSLSSVTDIISHFKDFRNNPFMNSSKWEVGDIKEYMKYLKEARAELVSNSRDTEAEKKRKVAERNSINYELAQAEYAYKYRTTLDSQRHSTLEKWAKKYYADQINGEKSIADAEKKRLAEAKKVAAEERREYEKTAKMLRERNYAQNTTASGALAFADSAKTIARQQLAVKYLTEAMKKLSTANPKDVQVIDQINKKILELNRNIRSATNTSKELSQHHRDLLNYADQLARKFALVFSVSSIQGYFDKLVSVRGEMELQKRSLEAILQSRTEGDALFNKTVQSALKSPFRIKELVTYTKQLAAYRIENDKLFDTTKRLADVSAGLGVDMQRLILAYGQVKAANFLKGTEVRQFTEAGVNMYGELQKYFKEEKGIEYSISDIVGMISDKKVVFEDVEAVIRRMTDAGGMFYKMQETQSETLKGKVGKLQDAIDMMYNQIGESGDGFLKGAVETAILLTNHWEALAAAGTALAGVLAAVKLQAALSSESLMLNAISAGVLTKDIPKTLTLVQALRVGLSQIANGVNAAASSLVSFVKGNLITLGIMAIAGAVLYLVKAQSDYNKQLDDVRKKHDEEVEGILKISKEYRSLSNEAKKAAEVQKKAQADIGKTTQKTADDILKTSKNASEALKELNKLPKEDENNKYLTQMEYQQRMLGQITALRDKAKEQNINLDNVVINEGTNKAKKISLNGEIIIDNDELDKVFEAAQKKVLEFYKFTNEARKAAVDVDNEMPLAFGFDNIKEDAADLAKEEAKVETVSEKINRNVEILGANLDKLPPQAKSLYEKMKDVQDRANMESVVANTKELIRLQKQIDPNALGRIKGFSFSDLIQLGDIEESFEVQEGRFLDEVSTWLQKLNKNGNLAKDPLVFKAQVDAAAAEQSWTEYEQELVYKLAEETYGIKVKFDTPENEQEYDYFKRKLEEKSKSPDGELNLELSFAINDSNFKVFRNKTREDTIKDLNAVLDGIVAGIAEVDRLAKEGEKAVNVTLGELDVKMAKVMLAIRMNMLDINTATREDFDRIWSSPIIDVMMKITPVMDTEVDNPMFKMVLDKMKNIYTGAIHHIGGQTNAEKHAGKPKKDKKKKAQNKKGASDDPIGSAVKYYQELFDDYEKLLDNFSPEEAMNMLYDTSDELGEYYADFREAINKAKSGLIAEEKIVPRLDKVRENLKRVIKDWEGKKDKVTEIGNVNKWISGKQTEKLVKEAKEQLTQMEKDVDELLSHMDLRDKFMHAGATKSLVETVFPEFGEIPSTLDELRKLVEKKIGEIKFKGKDGQEMADKLLQKLEQKEMQSYEKTTEEVIKNYRQRLTDQAQLDGWYVQERDKIFAKNPKTGDFAFDDATRKRMIDNLDAEYQKKYNKNLLDSLKNSKAYEDMFSNLGDVSTRALDNILDKLASVKDGLKGLDPTEMKEILKMEQNTLIERVKRNPLDWGKLIKEARDNGGDRTERELETENMDSQENINDLEAENAVMEKLIAIKEKKNELDEDAQRILNENVVLADKTVKELQEEINLNNERIKGEQETIATNTRAIAAKRTEREMYKAMAAQIKEASDKEKQLYKATRDLLELMGVSEEDLLWADFGQSLMEGAMGALELCANLELTKAMAKELGIEMNMALGVIGYVAIALETIVSVWSAFNKAHDANLEKQIQRIQDKIDALQESLEKLQKGFDDAFDMSVLARYRDGLEENIRGQIYQIQQQIELERRKKDSDSDKIKDWQKQIRELQDQLVELGENMAESLGGFGSQSNYKSAAQEFADAWYDAFKEGESGLEALEGKFDDFFDNLIKKQIMLRASRKFIEPILQYFDEIVSEDSEGGYDVTENELAKLNRLKDENLEGYNAYLNELMELWGISPNGTELSALQKGITGVTEETASALEGIMESMRFYLATQQGDVAAIRAMLENQYGGVPETSPMLTELRAQTELLALMSGAFYNGGNGFGVRTYIQ